MYIFYLKFIGSMNIIFIIEGSKTLLFNIFFMKDLY